MAKYRLDRHNLVLKILQGLNSTFLGKCHCFFGGGTRLSLELNEYRESIDIDLICADRAGYRMLRQTVRDNSLGDISVASPKFLRSVRTDIYGIRTFFEVETQPIKFEIVAEARIELSSMKVQGIPVLCLSRRSCFAEKLLANTDRGRDKSTLSRDLIDLAFMITHWPEADFVAGWSDAEGAYGNTIARELSATLTMLEDRSYRQACCQELNIADTKRLGRGLSRLAALA